MNAQKSVHTPQHSQTNVSILTGRYAFADITEPTLVKETEQSKIFFRLCAISLIFIYASSRLSFTFASEGQVGELAAHGVLAALASG